MDIDGSAFCNKLPRMCACLRAGAILGRLESLELKGSPLAARLRAGAGPGSSAKKRQVAEMRWQCRCTACADRVVLLPVAARGVMSRLRPPPPPPPPPIYSCIPPAAGPGSQWQRRGLCPDCDPPFIPVFPPVAGHLVSRMVVLQHCLVLLWSRLGNFPSRFAGPRGGWSRNPRSLGAATRHWPAPPAPAPRQLVLVRAPAGRSPRPCRLAGAGWHRLPCHPGAAGHPKLWRDRWLCCLLHAGLVSL